MTGSPPSHHDRAAFVLSVHATYGCRDSGVCCTSAWPIPIEAPALAAAERAIGDGRLRGARGTVPFARPADAPADTPALVGVADGACVFHRASGPRGCAMQHALGHAALPLACRQFPRVSVIDARGASITLSHHCPTAAALLESDAAVTIVEGAAAFPAGGEYTGLDVRGALPPALRPNMLMDWESWWQWEREAVALIASCREPGEVLARLAMAVARLRPWRPQDGALSRAVDAAFDAARHAPLGAAAAAPAAARTYRVGGIEGGGSRATSHDSVTARIADVMAAVPGGLRAAAADAAARTTRPVSARTHLRFLAAHAFANWTAHLGEGLRSWLRSIEAAHALVVSGLGVGDADLLLRHLCDQDALARTWSRAERET